MKCVEARHPEECNIWGKLAITGHYYYHDKSRFPIGFENLVNVDYRKHGDVDYFDSEDQVIEYFSDKIINKSVGISATVSSCTKGKPYRRSRRPYQPGYIDMLKVTFFLNETELAHIVLSRS